MKHRVLYYMVDGSTEAGQAALNTIEGGDKIELVGCAHEPNVCPTAKQLIGCEGFVGEFGPVDAACADAMAAAGMKIVSSMSIGLNHVAVERLAAHGITVTNCPGYCSDDVAQHAVALMLDLMRQVTFLNRDVRAGVWNPLGGYTMHRTQGRTLGLVFFGSIARAVAPIAQALGMKVLVWAPTKSAEELAAALADNNDNTDENYDEYDESYDDYETDE